MSFKHLFSAVLTSTVLLTYGCQQGQEVSSDVEGNENEESVAMEFDQQAPSEVSDEELQKFVEALQKIQPMSNDAQQKMMEAVQDAGMEPQRFSEIMSAQQMPDGDADVSADEQEKYEKAQEAIQKVQEDMQVVMQKEIESTGLTVEEYEAIMMTVQQDQDLLVKVQGMLAPDQPQE
ncbi:MAG: DUF4168 domain-containing protein [Cryomorphaceae bacterium]|nr:DUF4168 domain-containing protein [Cryomorphaceae bacterium]